MKHLFSKFLVAFFLTSAVVLSWSEYFFILYKMASLKLNVFSLFQLIMDNTQVQNEDMNTNFTCGICKDSFAMEENLKLHLLSKHKKPNYNCETCKKNFTSKPFLRIHIEKIHKNNFDCPYCSMEFPDGTSLYNHIYTKHKEKPWKSINKSSKVFKCMLCEKTYKTFSHLDRHKKATHDQIKDNKCDSCEKAFSENHLLKQHKRMVHEKIKDKRCDLCGKCFSTGSDLKKHVSAVHDKKRIQCPFCPKTRGSKSNLNIHIRTASVIHVTEYLLPKKD